MDNLKTFINSNREYFDTAELSQHHFERFQQKWGLRYRSKPLNWWLVVGVATIAGIIITAGLSMLFSGTAVPLSNNKTLASMGLSPEIIEVDEYYQSQVYHKHAQIQSMLTGVNNFDADIQQVIADMTKDYDDVLKGVANTHQPERAKFFLTQYYQTQLNVLNGIIEKVNVVSLSN